MKLHLLTAILGLNFTAYAQASDLDRMECSNEHVTFTLRITSGADAASGNVISVVKQEKQEPYGGLWSFQKNDVSVSSFDDVDKFVAISNNGMREGARILVTLDPTDQGFSCYLAMNGYVHELLCVRK